jgi:hypothetical protein
MAEPFPFLPYEEIWEKEARWLGGRWVLPEIVRHLRGRGLEVDLDNRRPLSLMVTLPLPQAKDEVSGRMVCIDEFIPEELKRIFAECTVLVLQERLRYISLLLDRFKGLPVDRTLIEAINAELAAIEREIEERDEPPLWELAAWAFGLHSLSFNLWPGSERLH